MKHFISPAAVLLALIGTFTSVHASLILEDQVLPTSGPNTGYTLTAGGTNLFGQNPTGQTTGFAGTAYNGASSNQLRSTTSNIVMPDNPLANEGGAVRVIPTGAVTAPRNNNRALAPYSSTDELWFSMLMQPGTTAAAANTVLTHQNFSGFLSGTGLTPPSSSISWTQNNMGGPGGAPGVDGVAFGVVGGALGGMAAIQYQTDAGGTGLVATESAAFGLISADTPYLWVAQLLLNTNGNADTLNVWLLTSIPGDLLLPATPTFAINTADILTAGTDIGALSHFVSGTGMGGPDVLTDAFRMGTDSFSVSGLNVVPEPGTLASGILGCALVAVLRSRMSGKSDRRSRRAAF